MVMQSESIEYFQEKIINSTLSVEEGDSTTIDYSDNDLDNTYATDTGVVTTIVDSRVHFDSEVSSSEANGDTLNASLLKADTLAINKTKYLDIDKDDTIVIDRRQTILFIVE